MPLPLLAIAALGGTLSMTARDGAPGIQPSVDAQAMLAALPQLGAMARVQAQTLRLVPSASLTFVQLLEVFDWANAQIVAGAAGVIVTQGTDTLEESAFLLDLLWPHPQPLVFTAAMRGAAQVSADGPANLLAAATVALAPGSAGRGVLVVMNDLVHAARHVRKTHTLALDAFTSPGHGPLGSLVEGQVRYRHGATPRQPLPRPTRSDHQVALLEATLAADTLLLEQLPALGYAGLVVAGSGAGHVSAGWAEVLTGIAAAMPVIIASRTGQGSTARQTYGYVGSEIDLQRRGALMAGELCPRKCRLLLWVLAGSGGDVRGRLGDWLAAI